MSAICGIIQLGNKPLPEHEGVEMVSKMNNCKVDSFNSLWVDNVFMGCGIQFSTPESLNEVLPLYDNKTNLFLTADAIIDNREELFNVLNISDGRKKTITDSELILSAYIKWGYDSPKYLVGDFAFAIWDINKKELFCARDHVATRPFYYSYRENVFYFCSVMKPLINVNDCEIGLNEEWIADFLSLETISHEIECDKTVYKNIFQIPPASSIVFNVKGIKINKYWDPLKLPKLKLKNDTDYENAFLHIYSEAVRCRLRANGSVGSMLSGGLDSGSVACIAARILGDEFKTLKTYTSIPLENSKNYFGDMVIPNERELIETIKNYYDNIELNFFDYKGKNAYNSMNDFVKIMEQPYKFVQNIQWINEIYKAAAKDGCRVLLCGSYGNFSISFGDFYTHALTLFKKCKFIKLINEIRSYARTNNMRTLRLTKLIARAICPYTLRKMISHILHRNNNILSSVVVNPVFASNFRVHKRLKKAGYNERPERFMDLYETRKFISRPEIFTHISSCQTKLSLYNGIIIRDPTRDKRVIEFCFRLPSAQFVSNGSERSLIRRAMKGILPDSIRLNKKRGFQSSDWIQRLEPDWINICNDFKKLLSDESMSRYFNIDKIKFILNSIEGIPNEKEWIKVNNLIKTLVFYRFYNKIIGFEQNVKTI